MEAIIRAGLSQLGLLDRVPPEAPGQLAEYGRLLLEKNRVMNLTAITDPEQAARLHMLDCASLLTLCDLRGKRLIDVGTGAGFPGLVLKILEPSLELTLLDGLAKRLDWLGEVCAALRLEGVVRLHGRAEELSREPGLRDSFDVAAARAVAELRVLCELCLPFVRPGGLFVAMKGPGGGEELAGAAGALSALGGAPEGCRSYPVPGAQVTHQAVLIRKDAPTPPGYPRRWARIQKAPL